MNCTTNDDKACLCVTSTDIDEEDRRLRIMEHIVELSKFTSSSTILFDLENLQRDDYYYYTTTLE
jgi:hypothetical protein